MSYTYDEIRRQPLVWREVLSQLQQSSRELVAWIASEVYDGVVFTGCGSSYNLALTAAYFWQHLNREFAKGVPSSEVLLFPEGVFLPDRKYLLFGISRSGETTETIWALTHFREKFDGITVGITCEGDSSLSRLVHRSIALPQVVENSVVMTQSFSSMLLAVLFLAMEKSGISSGRLMSLPSILSGHFEQGEKLVRSVAADLRFNKFIFLGDGPFYGIAWEGALKVKEMSITSTEVFHFLEFRHGPKSIVDEMTFVVALSSKRAFDFESKVIQELVNLGATVLHIGGKSVSSSSKVLEILFEEEIVDDFLMPLLDVVFLQLFGYFRAEAKGLNPDNPKNLTRVVTL